MILNIVHFAQITTISFLQIFPSTLHDLKFRLHKKEIPRYINIQYYGQKPYIIAYISGDSIMKATIGFKNKLLSNYSLLLAVVFGGFLIFGFSENIKGPAIPRMQSDFSLDELQIGLLLALNSLGYLLACSFTGVLAKRFGVKLTTMLAFGAMAFSGLFIYLSSSYRLSHSPTFSCTLAMDC